jgi:hypothetical protein
MHDRRQRWLPAELVPTWHAPVVCIQKARGSSPLSSTGQRPNAILKASEQSQTKSQTRSDPEVIYRHELRPMITTGADVMDQIFA